MQTKDTNATRSFYDRISKVYDVIADGGEHTARERGLAALAVQSGEQVLEVGYGTGHSLVSLVKAAGETGSVSGIDISQGMHDAALHRLQADNLADRVDLRVGVVPPLPWPDDHFDVVSMSFTLELFPLDVIPTVLSEIRRVLKKSGRLGVVSMSVTDVGQSDSMMEKTYKWMHQHFPHIVDCQPINAVRFVEEAGLQITHREEMAIWSMPVAILVANRQD
ncbi:MAG: methyltransferase domain-containing protein [Planctomycetaceae bacterium]|nr:methyltransferase domain-containing protein [Planctomycetaceae bacterium]